MEMQKEMIKNKIEELLAKEYYCTPIELNKKEVNYSINTKAEKPYIKILAYQNCVVVCTSKNLHDRAREVLQDKNRDEIFEVPFVYGQTIHYVPDNYFGEDISILSDLSDYKCEYLFDKDVFMLRGLTGFENSLTFDNTGFTSTRAVCIARHNETIVGIAGAAEVSVDGVWEVGVDVREKYRKAGLGSRLVKGLTKELLARDIVPYYSASVTNIGSQMVAYRCGYIPMWVDTFGTTLDGSSVYHDITKNVI